MPKLSREDADLFVYFFDWLISRLVDDDYVQMCVIQWGATAADLGFRPYEESLYQKERDFGGSGI